MHAALRGHSRWSGLVGNLKAIAEVHGGAASVRANGYGQVYDGARGAMVIDVVMSRQRSYEKRIVPAVRPFREQGLKLRQLVDSPPGRALLGLRAEEQETMVAVADNLLAFARDEGIDNEDEACRVWAERTAGISHAFRCEERVGAVKGIGLALFCYLRMRCGGDSVKPDGRVRESLRRLGFPCPNDPHVCLAVAQGAALELGTTELWLDQLLWWA